MEIIHKKSLVRRPIFQAKMDGPVGALDHSGTSFTILSLVCKKILFDNIRHKNFFKINRTKKKTSNFLICCWICT